MQLLCTAGHRSRLRRPTFLENSPGLLLEPGTSITMADFAWSRRESPTSLLSASIDRRIPGTIFHLRMCFSLPAPTWRIALRVRPTEIFQELREASRGGCADYYGITYEKIDRQMGVFWPCPSEDHPGTPRLFEDGKFFHPDGKAHFMQLKWRDSGDPVDAEFPIYLTTGRVVSQYLSGTQTRRIGALVEQYPEPKLEIHPRLAEQFNISTCDWVTITSRRSAITLQALVVRTVLHDPV